MNLANKTAIVTRRRRVGAAIASELVAEGAAVAASTSIPGVGSLAARCGRPGRVRTVQGDIRDDAALDAIFAVVASFERRRRFWSTARSGRARRAAEVTTCWAATLDVLADGRDGLSTAFAAPVRRAAGRSSTSRPCTRSARFPRRRYEAAKAGLLALTRSLRRAGRAGFAARRRRVNPRRAQRAVWETRRTDRLMQAYPLAGPAGPKSRALASRPCLRPRVVVNGRCLAVDGGMSAFLPEAPLR